VGTQIPPSKCPPLRIHLAVSRTTVSVRRVLCRWADHSGSPASGFRRAYRACRLGGNVAFNQLSESSFRFRWVLILAVLVALLNTVQYPHDGATASRVLANFELTGQAVKECRVHRRIIPAIPVWKCASRLQVVAIGDLWREWWRDYGENMLGSWRRERRDYGENLPL
jgi:hypothetical protein